VTVAIAAHATKIETVRIAQKDVGGEIDGVGPTFQASSHLGQRCEIRTVREGDEEIDILGNRLESRQGSDQRDP
jgi:hypothetical protein